MAEALHERYEASLAAVAEMARGGEITAGWLQAERSDFVRFNRGRVRQCGTVERATIELRLIADGRQARHAVTLTGTAPSDLQRLREAFDALRHGLSEAPPDPHLCFSEAAASSRVARAVPSPSVDELTDTVCGAAAGADLVGFYAGGPLACGFASSLGHRHWHETPAWYFDHSVYATGDKAVKATLAGDAWDAGRVREAVARAVASSRLLSRPARRLSPGAYRCYLGPRALAGLVDMLGWGGFSARAHASGQSPLVRLKSGEARFDARVQLRERLAAAGAPMFQADGFARPAETELVRDGAFAQLLVSPRSAREFGLVDNGASAAEAPEALWMAGGDLDEAQALAALGRGLAVSNFWYLNFSDRQACRITGMTRFATMWVEDGEPVAPVEVMRFDDSLYRVLGAALEALTRDPRRIPNTDSYEGRSFGSTTAPGAIVRDLRFTL